MEISAFEIVGLVGVTIVVSTGKIFNGLRKFLKSFEKKYNPLRWLGELISCSMCTGVWVGAIWVYFHSGTIGEIVVFGGFISVVSYVANEIICLFATFVLKVSLDMKYKGPFKGKTHVDIFDKAREIRSEVREASREALTEEEADILADAENARADLSA